MYQKLERTLTTGHVNKITCESWVSLTHDKVMTIITESVSRDQVGLFNEVRFVMNGRIGNDLTSREDLLAFIEMVFEQAPVIRDYQRSSLDYSNMEMHFSNNVEFAESLNGGNFEVDYIQCFIADPERFQLDISDIDWEHHNEDENPDYDLPEDQRQY